MFVIRERLYAHPAQGSSSAVYRDLLYLHVCRVLMNNMRSSDVKFHGKLQDCWWSDRNLYV